MRQSKFQRREQNRRYATHLETTPPEKYGMSSSTEQKVLPESRTLRLLRRLRNGWGMVLLTTLLSVYLMGFYHHASSAEEPRDATWEEHSPKADLSERSYLPLNTSTDYQDTLPGAVKSASKSFEIIREKKERDSNTLPGAIGLEGAFDEHGDKLPGEEKNGTKSASNATGPVPTPQKNVERKEETDDLKSSASVSTKEQNSEVSPSTKELASNDMVSTGEEKPSVGRRKKKKKKKRKRKHLKSATTSDSPESPTENSRDINRKKRIEKKEKINEKETGNEAASQSEAEELTTAEKQATNLGSDAARPMSRKMEELQVPGETGVLDEEAVKGYYGKLVKEYLAPFANGIHRKAFFDILRRRTYSLSPPGSNKGVQTILFQLIKQKLFLMDPYEVMKNSKPFYKTRVRELIGLFSDVARGGKVPDTEFLVAIHDCVQTVNAKHTYRGAVFTESNPTFTIVSCNFSDNIPIPMWEGDPVRGGLRSWDKKMEVYKNSDKTPWAEKKEKAVFRGGNRPSMFFKKKVDADKRCDDAGRSRLSYLGNTNPDLFDVSVGGRCGGKTHVMSPLSEMDHHQFKYILYAEGNCFWADRLNKQVFGPSAIIKQETPCGQFWEPLLKPMTHYIPTDFFFQDTVDQINWAKEHDSEVQNIVKNANEFAANFLSQKGIKTYVEVLLTEYTKLLQEKTIEPEKGSKEVTGR